MRTAKYVFFAILFCIVSFWAWLFIHVNRLDHPPCSPINAIIVSERPAMGALERDFWRRAIEQAAQRHGLDSSIVAAKIAQESHFNGRAVSERGARGAAQLMPMWTKGLDPFEIEANLDKGAEVLAAELKQTGGDYYRALRRYNGGPRGERMAETETYAARVLARVLMAERQCKVV
jgi:soluble lytic murein transglycosylase-like protein